ncbi:hypothetical protein [Streptomyces sp. RTd22]|uniref:hypothetical protein n=1 Tax=Streptomyces sp. RTd22 TaxID=1841249 RepID=UPI00131BF6B1|nr:hypothetical protein [Streptomyces sp. RTd22]
MTVAALAMDYRRIVELVESAPGDGEALPAKQIAAWLELPLVPAKIGAASARPPATSRSWTPRSAATSSRPSSRAPTCPYEAARHIPGVSGHELSYTANRVPLEKSSVHVMPRICTR